MINSAIKNIIYIALYKVKCIKIDSYDFYLAFYTDIIIFGDCMVIQKKDKEIFCPVDATMKLLGQKWNLQIIRALIGGKKRFNELSQAVGGVNARTLSIRLRELEAEGIIKRELLSSIPPWVEYELTKKGMALNTIIENIAEWGRCWMKKDKK